MSLTLTETRPDWLNPQLKLLPYLFAAATVLGAFGLRMWLDPLLSVRAPYLPFILAVVITARLCGRRPGFLAAALSTGAMAWLFREPIQNLSAHMPYPVTALLIFSAVSSLFALLVGGLREAYQKTAEAKAGFERQTQLVDLSHDAIITTDAEYRIVEWNAGAEELYGWRRSEVLGQVVYKLLRDPDLDSAAAIRDTLARDGRWEGLLTHFARDGRCLSMETRLVLVRDDTGAPARILGIHRDITARRRAEEALRQSEFEAQRRLAELQAIYDSAPIGLCVLDADLRWVRVNRKLAEFNGLPVEAHTGKSPRELLPDLKDQAEAALRRILETGEPMHNLELCGTTPAQPGQVRYWNEHWVPLKDHTGRVVGISVAAEEITEKKRAEEALRNAQAEMRRHREFLDAIVTNAPYAIAVIKGRELRFTLANPAFNAIAGPAVGRKCEDVFPQAAADDARAQLLKTIDTGEPWILDKFRAPAVPGGPERIWDGKVVRLPVTDGEEPSALFVGCDVTEKADRELAIREREAMLNAFFAASPCALNLFDEELRFIKSDPVTPTYFRLDRDSIVGKSLRDLNPRVAERFLFPILHRVTQTGQPESNLEIFSPMPSRGGGEACFRASYFPVPLPGGRRGLGSIAVEITDMKRAEEALSNRTAELDSLLSNSPLGFAFFDRQHRYIRINEELCRMNGLPEWAHVGRLISEVLPVTAEVVDPVLEEVFTTGRSVEREMGGETPGRPGAGRHWLAGYYPVFGPRGEVSCVGAFVIDITERKRAERALRDSEARFHALLEQASDAFFLHDWNGRFVDVNREACESLGYSREELLGMSVFDIETDFDQASAQLVWSRIQPHEPVTFDSHNRRKDGSTFPVEVRLSACTVGGERLFLGLVRDKTERQRMEQDLRDSETRYRGLFESMQEAFTVGEVICDPAGAPVDWLYLDANPAFEAMFGLKRADVVGRRYRDLFPNSDSEYWVQALGEVALTGNPAHLEHYGSARDRHYEAIAYSPSPGQFAAVFTDVTERKAAEERFRQAQKLESVGLLAGGVAHDFNNLLMVILGSASSALQECPTCEHSKAIVAASERAAHLTKQLLAYAGKGKFVVKPVDLNQVVAGSRGLLSVSVPKRVNVKFDLAEGLPFIEEDRNRIEQILMNLAINAGEAIPPKTDGRIEISTGRTELTAEMAAEVMRRNARAAEIAPGTYIWLEVRDNGTGMDPDTIARIFDPFFSTKFTGRGLGLAAVDGIVRSSKGFIDVSSSPGEGTAFRVHLPAPAGVPDPRVAKAPAPVAAMPGKPALILVVDDEEMVRAMAATMLKQYGYEVVEARDGKDALRVLAGLPSPPALVLLDLAMPVMGGDELVPVLAERCRDVKIAVTSGYPEEDARQALPWDAVAGFLQKPYTAAELSQLVTRILEGRSPVTARG